MAPTLSLLTLVGILLLLGIAVQLWFAQGAFEEGPARGAMALLVPGYALWYGWTRFSHPRRRGLVLLALGALVIAALGALLATTFDQSSGVLLAS